MAKKKNKQRRGAEQGRAAQPVPSESGAGTEELLPLEQVTLVDPSGAEILSEIFVEFEYAQKSYALITPAYPVVYLLVDRGEDEELEYLPAEQFPEVETVINEALKMTLKAEISHRGEDLIFVGELEEADYQRGEILELEGDDGEPVELLSLLEVDDGETSYLICLPEDPVIYPVELLEEKLARRLEEEELIELQKIFDGVMQELHEEAL